MHYFYYEGDAYMLEAMDEPGMYVVLRGIDEGPEGPEDYEEVGEAEGRTVEEAEADFIRSTEYIAVDGHERLTPREPYSGAYSYWE